MKTLNTPSLMLGSVLITWLACWMMPLMERSDEVNRNNKHA